jgi:thymidine kinase
LRRLGSLTAYCGPTHSGKTKKLEAEAERADRQHRRVQRFSGAAGAAEIGNAIDPATELVTIDDAQRFGDGLIDLAGRLATEDRIDVVVAGWELDATATPAGPMPVLLCTADLVLKLDDGVCAERGCRNPASRTQRFVSQKGDQFLPVCRRHHAPEGRPYVVQEHWFEEPTGSLEVIAGCMFSGKTQELIRRLDQERYAGASIQAFKPALDDRYALEAVASHRDTRFPALAVPDASGIRDQLRDDTRVVGMDEVQFFASDLMPLAQELADEGRHVILAGLELDFLGRPFGPMPQLMAVADRLTKLQASCQYPGCGSRQATRTQRLHDGKPAGPDDPLIVVGGASTYEARCRHHHEVSPLAAAEAGSDLEAAEALLGQD